MKAKAPRPQGFGETLPIPLKGEKGGEDCRIIEEQNFSLTLEELTIIEDSV